MKNEISKVGNTDDALVYKIGSSLRNVLSWCVDDVVGLKVNAGKSDGVVFVKNGSVCDVAIGGTSAIVEIS